MGEISEGVFCVPDVKIEVEDDIEVLNSSSLKKDEVEEDENEEIEEINVQEEIKIEIKEEVEDITYHGLDYAVNTDIVQESSPNIVQAHSQPNIILRKRKIKIEPDSTDNVSIIRQIQDHEIIKRKRMPSSTGQKATQSETSGAPIRCGQCTFSHIDPNEVERHRERNHNYKWERKFKCDYCDYTFDTIGSLRKCFSELVKTSFLTCLIKDLN